MITRKEVIRYLGYGQNIPDDKVMELINNCIKEVEAAAKPKMFTGALMFYIRR